MEQPVKCSSYQCSKGPSSSTKFCSGCKQARYCSNDCQKKNWKTRKAFCKHVSSNGASSTSMSCSEYSIKIAPYDLKAQALASEIHLALPTTADMSWVVLNVPMRRLVRTGKDTPENIALFFGQSTSDEVREYHRKNRLEALINPPMGSPMDVMARHRKWDENCPPLNITKASQAEEDELKSVRQMQDTIRQYMGSRGVEDVNFDDMRDILVDTFGPIWPDKLQLCQDALNSMDRNVRPPGVYD
ncbi:hypothetical protein F5Y02DRAFT_236569 [Annulohypoxylon stygium]|nr:hypothetical protein F5Y02DRAFT_236569 [Annulohypoxylon stygium]